MPLGQWIQSHRTQSGFHIILIQSLYDFLQFGLSALGIMKSQYARNKPECRYGSSYPNMYKVVENIKLLSG